MSSTAEQGGGPAGPGYLIRDAAEGDLDAIAAFEVDIARASFGAEAITDTALHRKRVLGALGKPGEVALVAVAARQPAVPLGWAWMSARTNSLTGARYGNFRSLAVADVPDRSLIGELLLGAVLRAAADADFTQLTGKVHAGNLGMRALYRKFGFEATHVTMERRMPAAGAPQQPAAGQPSGAAGVPPAGRRPGPDAGPAGA
jgi:L-amino acid N-acyltransferase YncA